VVLDEQQATLTEERRAWQSERRALTQQIAELCKSREPAAA
jgi:hypothetical protein